MRFLGSAAIFSWIMIGVAEVFSIGAMAQEAPSQEEASITRGTAKIKKFNHMDLSVTLGTTGVGFDVTMPINNIVQLRTGFTFMPHFTATMNFGVQVGDEAMTQAEQDAKFEKMSTLLEEMIGTTVDQSIDMKGKPTFWNFKLLVDVFPFKDKHWHLTGGFYWGPSKIAVAENAVYDATSLVAMSLYNKLYDKVIASYESYGDFPYISIGGNELYAGYDLVETFMSYGKLGVHVGDYKDGTPYRMVPDEDNVVKTTIKVNSFRPYLGFGYGGRLFKGNDDYFVSFDCGLIFWGGTPRIMTTTLVEATDADGNTIYDETGFLPTYTAKKVDLAKDVENIGGKVGDYVDVIKAFKVYPEISVRFSRRIF